MLDKAKYINHLGETIRFGENGLFVNKATFRDYQWKYSTQYKRINTWERDIRTSSLPIVIVGADCRQKANALYELIDKDVLAKMPGKLVVGDYYCEGFLYASKKSDYSRAGVLTETLSFASDHPVWTRERLNHFEPVPDEVADGVGYPYDYPFDYLPTSSVYRLTNTGFMPEDFRMTIFGPHSGPSVTIGGHLYGVSTALLESEYLVIDSRAKTITKVDISGANLNLFSARNRSSYIFEPIPTGESAVLTNGNFAFDIVLYDERSEPVWI